MLQNLFEHEQYRDESNFEDWVEMVDRNLVALREALPKAQKERPRIDTRWLRCRQAEGEVSEANRALEEAKEVLHKCRSAA